MKSQLITRKTHCRCGKCNTDLREKVWFSQWEAGQHYKANICDNCGKKTWVRVDFSGSGHDDWRPGWEEEE